MRKRSLLSRCPTYVYKQFSHSLHHLLGRISYYFKCFCSFIYFYKLMLCIAGSILILNLLTTTIVAPPSNASKWQIGFNSAFKGLITKGASLFLRDARSVCASWKRKKRDVFIIYVTFISHVTMHDITGSVKL
jgi:hypothetical protein